MKTGLLYFTFLSLIAGFMAMGCDKAEPENQEKGSGQENVSADLPPLTGKWSASYTVDDKTSDLIFNIDMDAMTVEVGVMNDDVVSAFEEAEVAVGENDFAYAASYAIRAIGDGDNVLIMEMTSSDAEHFPDVPSGILKIIYSDLSENSVTFSYKDMTLPCTVVTDAEISSIPEPEPTDISGLYGKQWIADGRVTGLDGTEEQGQIILDFSDDGSTITYGTMSSGISSILAFYQTIGIISRFDPETDFYQEAVVTVTGTPTSDSPNTITGVNEYRSEYSFEIIGLEESAVTIKMTYSTPYTGETTEMTYDFHIADTEKNFVSL